MVFGKTEAVKYKLGIIEKTIPGKKDGTQEMGVWASEEAIRKNWY